MAYRVIQWATGNLGRVAIEAIASHPELELAGCWVHSGTVAAQRFTWQGCVRGEPVITVAVNWLMGEEHLAPAWTFGPERERFEIEITGDPPAKLVVHGLHPTDYRAAQKRNPGMVATANHCVAAIPFVCRAAPGIQSYLDLPLVHGRADPALARPS